VAVRTEPPSLSRKALRPGATTLSTTLRVFNAELSLYDDGGAARPMLAQALPELNTSTWQVQTDGQMETTYRLKPGLTWHDGTALSAEDFVFAWRVYRTPDFGLASATPWNAMTDAKAPDPSTLVAQWSRPFPDAGGLDMPPMPRHLLEAGLQGNDANAFAALPYWTREYVGLGPYHLTQWEPGSVLEAEAFPGFVFGRPRIDRVQVRFMGDANAALASFLAGDIDVLADVVVSSQQLPALKSELVTRGAGSYVFQPGIYRQAAFQLRPELAAPKTLVDVRLRKALAYTLDKPGLNDAIYGGDGIMADSPLPASHKYFTQADQATTKYAYDPRKGDQFLVEAGFIKGSDGVYASAAGPFSAEIKTNTSAQFETEMHVLADGWRRVGLPFTEAITPTALVSDGETRATFSGVYSFGSPAADAALRNFTSTSIPSADNRWIGSNRGGWANADYDRLARAYDTTLDQSQRAQGAAQLMKILTDEVPSVALDFDPDVIAFVSKLTGPKPGAYLTEIAWNIHEWALS
jgi:peptide/nickel transport system substrate-binding protein